MSLNLQQLPLIPQEEEEELVLPDNWNNFQKAQAMFMQAKTEDDYRKAEQFADDNFDTNTEAGKRQKSLLWKNGAKDANTRIFHSTEESNNNNGNTEFDPDAEYKGNDALSKAGLGTMGLNQEQQAQMSLGINAGVGALNFVDNMLMGNKNFGAQSEAIDSAVHSVSGALIKSGNPYAMAAGAALEVANFATKATGQTVQGFDVNINNSGYSSNLGHMESKSNRDFLGALGFGGLDDSKIEQQLIDRNTQAQMALKAANISEDIKFEQEARMNSVTDIIKQNEIALSGGVDTSVLVAKKGAKIQKLKDFLKNKKELGVVIPKNIYLKITTGQLSGDTPITIQGKEYLIVPIEEVKSSDSKVVKAKNGAKLKNIEVSEQQSIIPEGTLHKNKHHLDVEGVTKKGIPVITVEDDSAETLEDIKEQESTIVQHAEIESQEVIYNKELTAYVEESLKEWESSNEDSILIEVGKRICKELLFNTEDPDNLIKQQKI